ncbi:Leucine-rich repeat-containing protein 74, partial [Globisporangium splendens]
MVLFDPGKSLGLAPAIVGATDGSSETTFEAARATTTQFLGRMSWDRDLLDISPADLQDSLRLSPQRKKACASFPPSPVLSPSKTASSWSGLSSTANSHRKQSGMSFQESLGEVEKLLDVNVRHRYHDHRKQPKSPVRVSPLPPKKIARAGPSKSYFEFAPLQDPMVLMATAAQEAEADDDDGDDDDRVNRDDLTSPQVKLKYFGAAAKAAYYKTYQELHGKSHLFVEKVGTASTSTLSSSTLSSTQSLRISPASRGNAVGTPTSSLRKPTTLTSVGDSVETIANGVNGDSSASNAQELKTPSPTSSLGHRRQALRSPISAVLAQNNSASFHSKPSLHSPRVLFLSSCIAQSQPAISILLREENCHTCDFSHQGLGDKFIVQFATCLPNLPLVEAINVCGNRLSDNTLNCLLLALENKPNLELDLSYNACGGQGAMAFGHTIRINTALAKLNLSYNNIGAKGAMVIASGHAANKGLRELVLDGNSVDLESGRALTHAASATKEMTLFNPADPTGEYSLELSDPYENVIAHELLRIATFKEGYRFVKLEYSNGSSASGGNKAPLPAKIELSRRPQRAAMQHLPDADAETLGSVFRLHNRSPVVLLFAQIDKDQSGPVDFGELTQALRGYGLDISEDRLAALLSEYDCDHNGSLQEDEFQDFSFDVASRWSIQTILGRTVAQYDMNNSGEIDEHEFVEFMKAEVFRTTQTSPDERETLDDAYEAVALREPSGAIWKVPTSGMLQVELDQSYDHHDVDEARRSSSDNSHNSRRRSTMGAPGATSTSDAVVSKLVASVQGMSRNTAEQAGFLKAVLADSDLLSTAAQAEELLLKQGDLKNTNRKLAALVRLLPQIVNRREAIALVAHLFDTKTQWTERFALRKKLGTNMCSVLLGSLTSKYCFDLTLPDDCAALKKFALIAQEEKQFSKNRSGWQDTSQHGNWENFRHATIDGKPVLLTSTYILNALLAPTAPSLQDSVPRDDQKRKVEFFYVSTTRPPLGTKTLTKRRFDQLVEILMTPISDAVAINSHHSHAQHPEPLSEGDLGGAAEKNRQNARLRWEILRIQFSQKLTQLEMLASDWWLSCVQAAELIAAFPNAINARAKAACILFGRLVDVDNFVKIYDELFREDQRECIHRLGWLSISDPTQPDRQYPPLDLSVRGERELVQILAQLALNEGGMADSAANLAVDTRTSTQVHFPTQRAAFNNLTQDLDNDVMHWLMRSSEDPREVTGQMGPLTILIPGTDLPPADWGNVDATGGESLKHHGIVKARCQTLSPASPRPPTTPRDAPGTPTQDQADFRAKLRSKSQHDGHARQESGARGALGALPRARSRDLDALRAGRDAVRAASGAQCTCDARVHPQWALPDPRTQARSRPRDACLDDQAALVCECTGGAAAEYRRCRGVCRQACYPGAALCVPALVGCDGCRAVVRAQHFAGKRANWQWRDETHGLVGTLIYIGSTVTMVFGLDSAGDAHFGGPDGVFRLKAMLVIAHAALLGKLLFMPKTGGSAAPLTSPPSPQQVKEKAMLHPSLTQTRSKTAGNRHAGLASLYNQQIDPHSDGEQDRAARAQRALPRAVRHDRRAGGAGAVALRAAPGGQRARVPRVLPSIGVCDARAQGVVRFPDACGAGEGSHVPAALGSCSDGRRRRGRVLGQGGEPEATLCVDALVDRRRDFYAVHAQHARGNTCILKACIWSLTDVHYVLTVHTKGLGTTFGGKKTSWQWKNPGHRIGGMLTFVLGGTASVYGVYSGGWGQAMLGADKQLQVSGLITAAYALLFVKALTTRAAKIPTQKKQA